MKIKTVKLNKTAPKASNAETTKTEAQLIWDEIKDLPIQMFGLPNQTVELHCTPVAIEPTHLYVTIRSSAVLPALETSLKEYADNVSAVMKKSGGINNSVFTVEMADKFVIVTRAKPSMFSKK